MKRKSLRFFIAAMALLGMTGLLSSCDGPKEEIPTLTASITNSAIFFNEQGVWDGVNRDEGMVLFPALMTEYDFDQLSSLQFYFSHFYEGYPYGFTASKVGDTKYYEGEMFNHQFSVITGGGPKESNVQVGTVTPFIVGNWDAFAESNITSWRERSCLITVKKRLFDNTIVNADFTPNSITVTNTCYTYYSMLYGDGFAKKFEKGDYLKLIVHGVKSEGLEETIEFYLANCKDKDPSKWFVTDWKTLDLTKLGTVKGLYFTMESSDNGNYGMNTPAYFGICDFKIKNEFFFLDI